MTPFGGFTWVRPINIAQVKSCKLRKNLSEIIRSQALIKEGSETIIKTTKELVDGIVRPWQQCQELSRNDLALVFTRVTKVIR